MEKVSVVPHDDVYVRIITEPGIANELSDHFSFLIPNHQFNPKVKARFWDGRIRLFKNGLLYAGLRKQVEQFCLDNEYEYEENESFADVEMSKIEAFELLPINNMKFTPRSDQLKAYVKALRTRRALLLSPTGTGKSFLQFMIQHALNEPTLILVPNTNLIHQIYDDFIEYDLTRAIRDDMYKIYAGQPKYSDKRVCISTWQSLQDEPPEWFSKFKVLLGDEAHGFTANKLTTIMEKLVDCPYKIGVSGTLNGTKTHQLQLEGLFGPMTIVKTLREAIDEKILSNLRIKCINLTYPEHVRSQFRNTSHKDDDGNRIVVKPTYPEEMKFLESNDKRNKFIINLANSLDGNVLILFQHIEHGGELHNWARMLNKTLRPIHFMHGQNSTGEERFDLQKVINDQESSITIAGDRVFSVGVNIPNLHHIIFASPSKARIKTFQSIGRGLRRTEHKTQMTLYDIADDLSWKTRKNFTLLHYLERLRYYNEEKLEYKTYKVEIKT